MNGAQHEDPVRYGEEMAPVDLVSAIWRSRWVVIAATAVGAVDVMIFAIIFLQLPLTEVSFQISTTLPQSF